MKIMMGNAPLLAFSYKRRSGTVPTGMPSTSSKYRVWIHDATGVRQGAGTIGSVNTSAGTCTYQSATTDWINRGIVVTWSDVDLGESTIRTFETQKILVEDPEQIL